MLLLSSCSLFEPFPRLGMGVLFGTPCSALVVLTLSGLIVWQMKGVGQAEELV